MMQPDGPERFQFELEGPSPSHVFLSMMASGSILATDCAEIARTDCDAGVGVCVPSFPSSAGRIESYESPMQTTRPSIVLRLNKPFSNPNAKHLLVGHRVLALT
jgi:hypothetical protein